MIERPLRPALLRAAAYLHLTGELPGRIRIATLRDLLMHMVSASSHGQPRCYSLLPEFVDEVEATPIVQAGRELERRGFSPHVLISSVRGGRADTVPYRDDKGLLARCHSSGEWSIDFGRERGRCGRLVK